MEQNTVVDLFKQATQKNSSNLDVNTLHKI